MHTLSRFLQLLGMGLAPLAMVAQMNNRISVGQMLQFLLVSVAIFYVGHTLQRYRGSSK